MQWIKEQLPRRGVVGSWGRAGGRSSAFAGRPACNLSSPEIGCLSVTPLGAPPTYVHTYIIRDRLSPGLPFFEDATRALTNKVGRSTTCSAMMKLTREKEVLWKNCLMATLLRCGAFILIMNRSLAPPQSDQTAAVCGSPLGRRRFSPFCCPRRL